MLLDKDPKPVFCRTPVGDEPIRGLESQPSVKRFRDDDKQFSLESFAALLLVLLRTSPKGPPMEDSQEIGIQLACLWLASSKTPTLKPIGTGSYSQDNLSGETVSFSWLGDEDEDEKSEETIGIEMES